MSNEFYSTKRVKAERGSAGTMLLTYQDGYQSSCPVEVFDRDYQHVTAMSFGHALDALKRGEKVARAGWNGKGMWLALQRPDAHSKMTLPYIFMFTATGDRVPWLASQTDMLADDWSIVP